MFERLFDSAFLSGLDSDNRGVRELQLVCFAAVHSVERLVVHAQVSEQTHSEGHEEDVDAGVGEAAVVELEVLQHYSPDEERTRYSAQGAQGAVPRGHHQLVRLYVSES